MSRNDTCMTNLCMKLSCLSLHEHPYIGPPRGQLIAIFHYLTAYYFISLHICMFVIYHLSSLNLVSACSKSISVMVYCFEAKGHVIILLINHNWLLKTFLSQLSTLSINQHLANKVSIGICWCYCLFVAINYYIH